MKIPESYCEMLLKAEGKALATYSVKTGAHVVPVSSLRVKGDKIILVNYFFGQTLKNLLENPEVSLAAWKGLSGCRVKGTVTYEERGDLFDEITEWIAETLPDRVVKGVLILTPDKIYDVSTGPDAGKEVIC